MEEGGFPRGGRKLKTKANKDGSNTEGQDVVAKKKRFDDVSEDEKLRKFLKIDSNMELPSIGYDTLVEGTVCLGCIRKIRETSLLVGLPGMTAGTVDLRSISTPYTQMLNKLETAELSADEVVYPLETMFKIGDCVVVRVMNVEVKESGKHNVILSMDPHDIHQEWRATDLATDIVMTGAVKSKEDKGFIIDLGIKGVNAFLPMSSAVSTERKLRKPFGIGQLISVNITRCEVKRLMAKVTLNCIPAQIKQVCVPEGQGSRLLPGMRVSCIILEERPSGLMVSFLDSIGRVHIDHLAGRHKPDIGDTVHARILFIPPWDVGPYLTLDEVGCFPYFTDATTVGNFFEKSESRRRKGVVMSLEPRGAKIKLQGGGCALLKRQRASDRLNYTDEEFKKDFRQGTQHEFRVLEYSPMDKMYIVSAQESLLNSKSVINIDELNPGDIHSVVIQQYNEGGAVVKLGDVKGFIPYIHFRDKVQMLSSQFIQKKYSLGSTVLAKVFHVDLAKNSVIFTAKKTLRQSKGIVASSFGDLKVGTIGHGIVRFVAPNNAGIRVQIIGGLLGFVPKSKLPRGPDSETSLRERFPVGLSVEFKVLEVDEANAKAIFSLDLPTDEDRSAVSNDRSGQTEEIPCANDGRSKKKKKVKKAKVEAEHKETERPKGKIPVDPQETSHILPKKKKAEQEASSTLSKKKKVKKENIPNDCLSEDSGIVEVTPTLKLSNGKNFWDVSESSVKDETESEEDNISDGNAKNKSKVAPKKVGADKDTDELLTEQDHEQRLQKNSSDPRVWKAFKDFALKSGDPSKAVSMIKGVKDKIPFRDEKGKLHCWMTILQIEIQYGTENSAKSVLEEAVKVNDPIAILDRVAQLYDSLDKKDEAEQVYRRRLKMQIHQPDSWINLALFFYRNNKPDSARQILPNALQSLSEKDQIYVTAKFAKMEIEYGDIEKGRSMFLTICLQRVKRGDLWLLFANSLYKMKEFVWAADALRTAMGTKQLTPKESRPILKRLVEIEKLHGTPESMNLLKSQAAEYLNLNS